MSNNETLIPIPGRLHSVAVEGNVVGANEVVDDTNYDVPKKQSEINADTALEIENIKAKDSNIESLIPSQATSNNQLADKNFVNSSISTATADFKGTYNTLSELQAVTANANDYGFIVTTDATGNTVYKKYKYTENNGWSFEYDLNNSSFTAEQWATIQSGMTSALTNKLVSLPTNAELQEALVNALNSKQDVITDLSTIRNKATTAYQKPAGGIPATDLANEVIPSFTIVDDHSGAGDDPNKIYIPSAESEKETHDSVMVVPATENSASAKLKGTTNIVRGAKSVAFGDYNNIGSSAYESIVAGRMNLVGAPKGAAFGNVNWVGATNAFATGGFNKITRNNSFAEGTGNYVNGTVAHMEGNSTLQITLTGAANTTTYTITETLPSFFIGLPVFYAVSSENNDGVAIFTRATIIAIDTENNTITLDGTLSSSAALENATARVLCATTQLKSSHVEGRYNFIILNDALTENPLQDTIINDLLNTEKEDRLQGGHVEGFGNVIAGKYSHAEGGFNLIVSQFSHAEGYRNKVLKIYAHAEGFNNIAEGNSAHAEGSANYAHGAQSHAEGYSTKTFALRAHAEGYGTIAGDNDGFANHAEGYGTIASGNSGNHSEGFATMVSGSGGAHAEGYGGYIVHLTGAENATTYSVDKAPLDNWLNSYVISNGMVTNSTRKIIAIDKINNTITVDETFGAEVTPDEIYKVISQLSLGSATHVEGFMNIAKGNASHAEGYNTYTPGLCSHAEGKRTVAVGKASHVQGENNIAQGDYSHSEGYGNKAFGKSSHAGGDGSLIVNLTGAAKSTTYSVDVTPTAEWVGCLIKTTIDNDINVYFTITEIDATNNTITVNETLDGTNALSSTPYSIALGGSLADYSFAHGRGVQAGTEAGAVFGKFNVPRNNALFAIGNGTSYTDQHDAFYVDVDGNVYIAGNIVSDQMTQLTNKITELENRIAALEGNS